MSRDAGLIAAIAALFVVGAVLLVVEATQPVPWSAPQGLTYDPDAPPPPMGGLCTKPVRLVRFEIGRKSGFNASFGDAGVRFINRQTDEATLRSLIARRGRKAVDLSKAE
jgi:hypothetical protein